MTFMEVLPMIVYLLLIVFLVVLIAMSLLSCSNDNENNSSSNNYTGYCRIEGTYRNRYVNCYGNYNPRARERALERASLCNRSPQNISGCTSTYR